MVYVTSGPDNTTSVIDGKTNNVVKAISVGKNPFRVAVNPNTNLVYVVVIDGMHVSVIDGKTDRIVKNITVGVNGSSYDINTNKRVPWDIAINPNTNMLYVSSGPRELDL